MAPSCYSTLISIQETLTFMPGSSLPSVFPWTSSCDRGSRAVWISSSVALGSHECICSESLPMQSCGGMGSQWAWSWGRNTVTASWMEQKLMGTPRASAPHVPPQPTSSRVSLLQPCFFDFCPLYPHPLWSASGPYSTLQPQRCLQATDLCWKEFGGLTFSSKGPRAVSAGGDVPMGPRML